MKKWLIAASLILALALIIGCAVLCVRFIGLYTNADETTQTDTELASYVREHWSMFDVAYDAETQALTLKKTASMTYEKACNYGAQVYSGELAPETYLSELRSIALDVLAKFDCPSLSVTLCYESTDGKTIFSVASDGTIQTCWE